MTTTEEKTKRYVYLDFLKIFAMYLVMFNHTGTKGFFLFSVSAESRFYWLYLFISIADKIAVPLFFMVSGAVLLSRNESIGVIIKKRVLRIVVVLTGFSLFQYAWSLGFHLSNLKRFSLADFGTQLYSDPMAATYWYLYAYIGYLLLLPFLKKIADGMSDKEFLYLLILRIFMTAFLPMLQYLIWKGEVSYYSGFSLKIVTEDVIFYPLTGHYLCHRMPDKFLNKKNLLILSCLSIVLIGVSCIMTNYRCIRTENWGVADNQVFHGLFVYIPAIWVFLAARLLFEKWPPSDTCSKMWTMLGKSTLGVMLIEGVIRSKLEFLFHFLNHMVGSMTACALWILACLAVGVGVTWIMGHIPVLRKFV